MTLFPLLASIMAPLATAGTLFLNQATAAELATVDGVDTPTAERIVALRGERKHLGSIEALRILRLDAHTLRALREYVAVDMTIHKVSNQPRLKGVDEVMTHFSHEPDVLRVQAMAMSYSNTNPELVQGWLAASKVAFALPAVTLSYDKDFDNYDTWNYLDLDGDGEVTSEEYQLNTSRADDDDSFGVRLAWRLDKIVMSSERIRVINEAQDIVKLRDKVLDEVTRVYFDRRRLQVEQLLNPPSDLKTQIKNELRLQELTANIDALTGGKFSAALPRE
jgi:hypothetical protein